MEALDSTGSRIRYLRKRAGLSQEAIAAMIYVSREAFRDWELNESQPGCDSLIALAKCFRVSVDFILGIHYQSGAPKSRVDTGVQRTNH